GAAAEAKTTERTRLTKFITADFLDALLMKEKAARLQRPWPNKATAGSASRWLNRPLCPREGQTRYTARNEVFPLRLTSNSTGEFLSVEASAWLKSLTLTTALWLTSRITSPGCNPASAARLARPTSPTTTPLVEAGSLSCCAVSASRFSTVTPSRAL